MKILVTGSTGYIGSHTCVELAKAGFELVGLDNLSNSQVSVHKRLESLIGKPFPFYQTDIRDSEKMSLVFKAHRFDGVIHFAGLKAVGESVEKPLEYYDVNVNGSLKLLDLMQACGVPHMVFSSSATVYGDPDSVPIDESAPARPTNPYGRNKWFIEEMIQDQSRALGLKGQAFNAAVLRYFNPVGAHESGQIGENPVGIPNNLMPFVAQVAWGKREKLSVFGDDYPTPDGTGVRDYIHVVDLAKGHVAALQKLIDGEPTFAVNLGTGKGTSVLEMVQAFEKASGRPVPYQVVERRPGDVAACWASTQKAEALLGWRAELGVEAMCNSTWQWQQKAD